MPSSANSISPRHVSVLEGCDSILSVLREDACVVIKDLLTEEQVRLVNEELQPVMDSIRPGSTLPDEEQREFYGHNTKRLNNLVTHSKTFREEILDNDLIHNICEGIFIKDAGAYWINAAQIVEVGPGSRAQPLHRDQWQYPVFTACGPKAPEAIVNFMVALTDFTEDNGATRVIPGSHKWEDFDNNGTPEDTIPVVMEAGEICLFNGKIVHSGSANRTRNFKRRGLSMTVKPSYLTPEEAFPFLVKKELVSTLSPRAQRVLGFTCQFVKDSPGIWKCDYNDTDDIVYSFPG
jgi:ectoine hydroxylase-related dioxygenase (phytanoyl-CoA dioxygenase family)